MEVIVKTVSKRKNVQDFLTVAITSRMGAGVGIEPT